MFQNLKELISKNTNYVTTNTIWILAFLMPFILVQNYFAFLGWGIIFVLFSFLIILFKGKPSLYTWTIFSLISLIALFLSIRSNLLISIINFTYILGLFGYLVKPDNYKLDIVKVAFLPISYLGKFLGNNQFEMKPRLFQKFKILDYKSSKLPASDLFKGFGITLLVLIIIIPLLASTNNLFASRIGDILNLLNIFAWSENLGNFLLSPLTFLRACFAILLLLVLPRFLSSLVNQPAITTQNEIKSKINSLTWLIPKIATTLTLLIYLISQLEVYLASKSELAELGYSYGNLINEIFVQLSIVSLVVFGLLYFDRTKATINKVFDYILAVLAFFLLGVALKTNLDYIQTWGLTTKRLFGFVAYVLIIFNYIWHFICLESNKSLTSFWRGNIVFMGCCVVIINILNFDRLIYTFNSTQPKYNQPVYLATLSADSGNLKNAYISLKELRNDRKNDDNYELNKAEYVLHGRISYLQTKYSSGFNLFSFNFSEYHQYQEIKDLKTNVVTESLY